MSDNYVIDSNSLYECSVKYFQENLFDNSLEKILNFSETIEYSNPYLDTYRANFTNSNGSKESQAMISIFLGSYLQTSLTTSFARTITSFLISNFDGEQYKQSGIVKIKSALQGEEYICLIKTGPNNSNSSSPGRDKKRLEDAMNFFEVSKSSVGYLFPLIPEEGKRILGDRHAKYLDIADAVWIGGDFWRHVTGVDEADKIMIKSFEVAAENSLKNFKKKIRKDHNLSSRNLYNLLIEVSQREENLEIFKKSRNL